MNQIIEYKFNGYTSFYNTNNSKNISIPNYLLYMKDDIFNNYHFFDKVYPKANFPTTTICLNISSNCNLNCVYCFNHNKHEKKLNFDQAKEFIDTIIKKTPNSKKYIIDLSGSGEPLLNLDLILKIANYAQELSNKIGREVLVTFISNGTLLTPAIAKLLQEHFILFGISLDGDKEFHDKNRKFINGEGSYDRIISNYQSIEDKQFVGVGMTYLPEDKPRILESYLFLSSLFNTISCRISRDCEFSDSSLEHLKIEYSKLTDFIIDDIKEKYNISFLTKMINGDDYFGRYIIKVACNANILSRCDAGVARFSLGTDNKVYICSPAIDINELCIDLNSFQSSNLFNQNIGSNKCNDCYLKPICGGECKIVLLHNNGVPLKNMCELKKHLFYLSIKLVGFIQTYSPKLYKEFIDLVTEVLSRMYGNTKLLELYDSLEGIYSFVQLKQIFDYNRELFDLLYKKYIITI